MVLCDRNVAEILKVGLKIITVRMAQTTIQKEKAIRKGSVRVLVGDNFSSLTDIGAIRDPKLVSLVEQQEISFDNVNNLRQFAEGAKVQFEFLLTEINLTNLAKFDKGLVSVESVAGAPVAGATQTVFDGSWEYNQFVKLANQNGDGTSPTVNSVTGATNGLLVSETDYFVGQNNAGDWGIFVIDSATVTTESQNLVINYDYTPSASKKITFTQLGTKELIVMRLTNTDADGKVFKIDVEDVTNVEAPSIDFAGDDEADIATVPMKLQGYIVEITDEQQIT